MFGRNITLVLSLGFLSVPFIGGLFDFAFHNSLNTYEVYMLALTLGSMFILFIWYRQDSNHIGYKRITLLNIMVIGFTIIALPYYFFKSRGLKKGIFYSLLFILLLASYFAASIIGLYIGDNYICKYAT
jgi:hypothetical protein